MRCRGSAFAVAWDAATITEAAAALAHHPCSAQVRLGVGLMAQRDRTRHASSIAALIALRVAIVLSHAARADAAEIVFTAEVSGGLYVMDARTLAVKRKSLGLATIEDLTYSARNRTMAFIGSRKNQGERELFLLQWPGSKLQQVPYPKEGTPYRPQFDPQGRYLYAVNYGPEIFRYSLQGGQWTRIPVQGVPDLHVQGLALSPSGQLAAISPADFKGFLIADVAADRLRVIRTVLADFESCTSAHWIDDTRIVFLGRKTQGYQSVWLLNMQSGHLDQLTQPPLGTRDFLSLSRDGTSVVFTASDSIVPPEWTVWRLDLNSKQPTRLIRAKQDNSFLFPTWID